MPRPFQVVVEPSRDALLTDFGKTTLAERYLLPGETYQDLFARVAGTYADDQAHAQRLYDYMSRLWFMPATPILSNGGAGRGLPISCFLNTVPDSVDGIRQTWNENIDLAKMGGGIGTDWSQVRSIGEAVRGAGQTSGIIPFVKVMDSLTLAISQGSLRRGSAAVYLDIHHPEIEEFIEIRKPSGDANRKALNLHHGVNITDEFMCAVDAGTEFALRSPKDGAALRYVDARSLWQKILEIRLATGEPYMVFIDRANEALPDYQRAKGLKVRQSNLCTEIMLATDDDRTAVCCLSSVNAETYLEWKDHPTFVKDLMRFLDNVLQDFIDNAPPTMARAVHSAQRERSIGLGLMGFHSFLQSQGVPFESAMAKSWNMRMFKHLRRLADDADVALAHERGPCPDARDAEIMRRFSHKLSVAPTASISIIAGGCSPGIEPTPGNIFVHKTLSGSVVVKNPYLDQLLRKKVPLGQPIERWVDRQWASILEREGSVQHLDFLTQDEKDVFKTGFEIDQRWVIEFAADRTPSICQGQSVNLFLPADIDKWDLHMLHFTAWEKGNKSLYYLRSKSVQRGATAGASTDYDECLACQ